MKIAFRADSSEVIGSGHVMRCLTLAENLRERGADVRFVCRDHAGNLIPLLEKKGIHTAVLPRPASSKPTKNDYAVWLGVTQATDAAQTVDALGHERADWLVVDNYGLSVEWEQRLRPHSSKVLAIDDLADRQHDCDVLLDQNFSSDGAARYAGLVPQTCKPLLGPRYALMHPEFARRRNALRAHRGSVKRVFVFFGGADPQNATGLALDALSGPDFAQLEVDVVVGASNPRRKDIERRCSARPRTVLHKSAPHLADLLSKADIAIGAGGATTWERMCLGVPTLLISIAKNQRPASEALAKAGLVSYIGPLGQVTPARIAGALTDLIRDAHALQELSIRNQLLVDGLGARRLTEVMIPTEAETLHLRPARPDDVVLFYGWANDAEVRKNAFNTKPIPWSTHQAWFGGKLRATGTRIFVLEANGLPVGQIRFDTEGEELRIDYSLDEAVRGRGWGAHLVAKGIATVRKILPGKICGVVKLENKASQSVFKRLGFTRGAGPHEGSAIFSLESTEAHQQ